MQTTGKVGNVNKVHILDPIHGELVEYWKVDEDISRETFEKFKDKNDEIYVVHVYEKGEMKQLVVNKEIWKVTKEQIEKL